MKKCAALATLLAYGGCSANGSSDCDSFPSNVTEPVPEACSGSAFCYEIHDAPSIVEWIGDSDLVVVGTVAEFAPVWTPALEAVNDGSIVDDTSGCSSVEPALDVVLVDVSSLYVRNGTLLPTEHWCGQEGALRVRIGAQQIGFWTRLLVWEGDQPRWLGLDGGKLVEGQRLGALLYADRELDLVGLSRDDLFQVLPGGVVRLEDPCPECGPNMPVGLDGLTVEQLKARITTEMAGVQPSESWFQQQSAEKRLENYVGTCFPAGVQ